MGEKFLITLMPVSIELLVDINSSEENIILKIGLKMFP
jgi:hypothetical protein